MARDKMLRRIAELIEGYIARRGTRVLIRIDRETWLDALPPWKQAPRMFAITLTAYASKCMFMWNFIRLWSLFSLHFTPAALVGRPHWIK